MFFKRKPKQRSNLSYIRGPKVKRKRKPIKFKLPKLAPKSTKKKPFSKYLFLIILGLLFGTAFYFCFFTNTFLIKNISISGKSDNLPQNLDGYLSQAYGINIFLLNEEKISEEITKIHSDIKNITFKRKLPDSIEITLDFYPEVVNFLIKKTPSDIAHSFVVNETGKISRNYYENQELQYLTLENVDEEMFDSIMNESIEFDIERIKKALNAKKLFEENFNIGVTEVKYYKIEREVHLKTEKGFSVWLDLTKSVEEQINKLKRGLSKLDIHNEALLYIDLRIGSQNGEKIIFRRATE